MAGAITIVPAIKGGPWDAELGQGAPYRQRRLLDQPDDLQFLGGPRTSYIGLPIPEHAFFEHPVLHQISSLSWL